MAGKESDHAFFPLFFLSCLIFLVCYAGVSWLLAKDRRVSRENLHRFHHPPLARVIHRRRGLSQLDQRLEGIRMRTEVAFQIPLAANYTFCPAEVRQHTVL